ncbi:tetratricopeptide repeat protein 14 homolog isoform X2 [Spodoptera litura]|uniref:Tetratricopeptide repeat protein 14 homolog isoform X2 n=1 Tax=Spodoptera litura TaxID=69820 RepID=A0A9J7DQ30_SPOLT|nr:tetratricopeptide repeat protein 14 homolog isoform X2 [Spodoptera litura]
MDTSLDASLVTQSINYHGQQLQKTWEAERGEDDLSKIGVGALDFAVYQSRHKHLTFQDRGKRLKLHQFITKEANALFDTSIMEETPSSSSLGTDAPVPEDNLYALMPPFETFLSVDKLARLRHFFDNVKTGELIIGAVINRTTSGMMLKVLCTAGPTSRYVADINVKAFLPVTNIIPAVDKKNVSRNYLMNDTVCCEVIEVIPDTDKMVCGMKGVTRGPDDPPPKPPLGLLTTDDFPLIYKKTVDMKGESYEAILEKSPGFNNPNCVQYLSELLGISNMHCTNFPSLRGGFVPTEYADELRQAQASKWAFRSVAEGIEHFKAGRHSEAFQCLNKALSIDPRNVEGLVARGALYANSGTFKKAIEDFETSLKLNPNHANARKYLGETLVALGRSYEDENKITEAQKAYEDCLAIIPFHEEAQNSLDFLKSKTSTTKPLIEPAELLLPGLTGAKSYEMKETLKQLLNLTDKKDKKKKKKRGKGKKKRSSSSSSSSSDSSSSSSSSDSSSSSSETSDSEGPNRKKKRRSQPNSKRQRSLSPLSKRMEMLGAPEAGSRTHNSQFNHPYGYQPPPPPVEEVNPEPQRSQADIDYELKVRKFLEMTKEDSDYEDKVRNFLEETAQYKRNRKMQELGQQPQPGADRDKKKKKKKDKSVPFTDLFCLGKKKKESKRKRKEQEREEKRKAKLARAAANNEYSLRDLDNIGDKKLRDAIRKELKSKKRDLSSDGEYDRKHDKRMLDDMHGLEELESKLSAYHVMVEKEVLHKRDGRGSLSPIDQAPPPPLEKPKWKMSMSAVKDTVKKKETPVPKGYKEHYAFEDSSDDSQENNKPSPSSGDKNVSVRRAMAMKEPPPLPSAPPPNKREPDPPGTEPSHPVRKGNIVLDKFGSFRLAQEGETPVSVGDGRPEQFVTRIKPPSPSGRRPRSPPSPRRHSSNSSDDDRRSKRSRSRSRPRKYRSRSRSRSRSASSASGSVASRRRRSGSPRSRSRSDASRSYYSRSRSRSRSGSRFRRFVRRGNWRGRGGYERGTYYRPRFHTYNGGGGGRGRGRGGGGDFRRDDGRRFQQEWRDNRSRGGRPFRPRRGGGGRGRPFRGGGFRDFRDRRGGRYSRSRSPERPRRSRSYSPERRDKDRDSYSRYSERDSHRSEGEYEEERYVDRKEYDGKWADGNEPERNAHPEEKQPAEPAPKE